MEDNIKKFEGFLDRMQGLLDNTKKQGHIIVRVEDLENAFPELKESEDERIRKMIINHLTQERGSLSNEDTADAIKWLEKQGEQPQGKTALEAGYEWDGGKGLRKIKKEPVKEELILSELSFHKLQDILEDLGLIDENGKCHYTAEEIFRAGLKYSIGRDIKEVRV